MAGFQNVGSKSCLVMEPPQKIGVCHNCEEDVDTWDRVIEVALWTRGKRVDIIFCNRKCKREFINKMDKPEVRYGPGGA